MDNFLYLLFFILFLLSFNLIKEEIKIKKTQILTYLN